MGTCCASCRPNLHVHLQPGAFAVPAPAVPGGWSSPCSSQELLSIPGGDEETPTEKPGGENRNPLGFTGLLFFKGLHEKRLV